MDERCGRLAITIARDGSTLVTCDGVAVFECPSAEVIELSTPVDGHSRLFYFGAVTPPRRCPDPGRRTHRRRGRASRPAS